MQRGYNDDQSFLSQATHKLTAVAKRLVQPSHKLRVQQVVDSQSTELLLPHRLRSPQITNPSHHKTTSPANANTTAEKSGGTASISPSPSSPAKSTVERYTVICIWRPGIIRNHVN